MSSSDGSTLVDLLGPKLISQAGAEIEVASLAKSNKSIALYFSASWCPPCRAFSPKLSEAYAEYKKIPDGDDLELIFVSSDSDVDAFNAYRKKMSFPALPFERRDLKHSLSEKFGQNYAAHFFDCCDNKKKIASWNCRTVKKQEVHVC